MDEKLLILLGLGAIGYLAATNLNDDSDCDDENEQNHYQQPYQHINNNIKEIMIICL